MKWEFTEWCPPGIDRVRAICPECGRNARWEFQTERNTENPEIAETTRVFHCKPCRLRMIIPNQKASENPIPGMVYTPRHAKKGKGGEPWTWEDHLQSERKHIEDTLRREYRRIRIEGQPGAQDRPGG